MTTYDNFLEDSTLQQRAAGVGPARPLRGLSRAIDSEEWNAFWEEFYTTFDMEAMATLLEADASAPRRVVFKPKDPLTRFLEPALRKIASSCGAIEEFVVTTAGITMQFTLALAARKMRAYVARCGVPAAGIRPADITVTVVATIPSSSTGLRVRPYRTEAGWSLLPPSLGDYLKATFEAVGSKNFIRSAGADDVMWEVSFETAESAREAVHMLATPLAARYHIEVVLWP
jgi:hypothetical protein